MTIQLPAKFNQHIINDFSETKLSDSTRAAKECLDSIYTNHSNLDANANTIFSETLGFQKVVGYKTHIVTHPNMPDWILKCRKSDENCGADIHIHRVRKAKKIADMRLPNIVVPEKYIYRLPNNEHIVLARKLELETNITESIECLGSVINSTRRKKLSPSQGWNIVHLIFQAKALDLSPANIDFDKHNNVVLTDTEPAWREARKKAWKWIPGASRTFCHIVGVILTGMTAKKENLKTRIMMHLKKIFELGRLLVNLSLRAGALHLLSKGFTVLALSTGNSMLLAASPLVAGTAFAAMAVLGTCGAIAVGANVLLPLLM
jgi:hypothetical protein